MADDDWVMGLVVGDVVTGLKGGQNVWGLMFTYGLWLFTLSDIEAFNYWGGDHAMICSLLDCYDYWVKNEL